MIKARIRDLKPDEPVADAEAISFMLGGVPVGTLQRWAKEDGWPRCYGSTSRGRITRYSVTAAKSSFERRCTGRTPMLAQRFRKKPVEIEAWRWPGGAAAASPIIDWALSNGVTATWTEAHEGYEGPDGKGYDAEPECIRIDTLEGTMRATVGDYIIRGVKGEFYPCKPDIFEATYDHLGDTPNTEA